MKLLRIEWNKLLPSRSFRVLIVIYTVVFATFLLIVNFFFEEIDDLRELANLDYNPLIFPDIWVITMWLAQTFTLLPAIIVITLVVNEFNYRTARQHVIDGLTRWEIVAAKFSTVVFMALICTGIIFAIGTVVGLMNSQHGSPTGYFESFVYIEAFFLRTLALLTFAMFLAFWIKRTGVAILLFIVLHLGFVGTIMKFKISENVGHHMPIVLINRLLHVMKINDETVTNYKNLGLTDVIQTGTTGEFILAVVYIGMFVGLSYAVLVRKDLK